MRLGPYELVRMIGAGGMGEVWAAHRTGSDGHEVLAVKCLPERLADDPAFRHILLQEARLAMLLRHPNIVHVFDAGESGGQAYIAMEFVHGLDLARLRKHMALAGERLPPVVVAYVIAQVLQGLDYAHNLVHDGELISLVHRDISPHNVMLSVQGEVKLTDFGVARLSSEDSSGTHVKGKARYMPPEQLRGESRSPTVDLFAAGAVLQELLDGQVFRGEAIDDARLLGMAVDGIVPAPARPREIPRPLERLRRGLLAPDPLQRIHTAAEALELLERWSDYRDAGPEVAQIVLRHLERQAGIEHQPTQTGLAHGATFLQTNGAIEVDREDDFLGLDGLGLEDLGFSLDDFPGEPPSPATPPPPAPAGPDEIDIDAFDVEDEPALESALEPALEQAASAPATGGHRSVAELAASELVLDLDDTKFARHVATSPNPTLPQRRPGRLLASIAGAAVVLGLAGVAVSTLLDARPPQLTPPPSDSGLRKARVIGASFAGYAGFRHRRMDKLAADDILYEFVSPPDPNNARDPKAQLAALDAGEAEFALTTLAQLLLARADPQAATRPGAKAKIVAIVDVSRGAEALVLDSVEHKRLRSLDDLAAVGRELGHTPVLAYAGGTPSAYFDQHLDALLVAVDQGALQRANDYPHARAVYEALTAAASEDAPIVAAMLTEPWLSMASEAGLSVAASTRDLPYAVIDVLVASERILADDPQLVHAVVASYYAVVFAQLTEAATGEALIEQVAREQGLSPAEATRTLAGLCRLDASTAESWLEPAAGASQGLSRLAAAVDATWSTLRHSGRVEGAAPSLDSLIDASAIVAAAATEREQAELERPNPCAAPPPATTKPAPAQALGELELPAADAPWFQTEHATLSAAQDAQVAELAARLRSFNATTVTAVVTGFGDPRSDKPRALGQARARALVDALQAAGVEINLEARGAGNGNASAGGPPPSQLRVSMSRITEP